SRYQDRLGARISRPSRRPLRPQTRARMTAASACHGRMLHSADPDHLRELSTHKRATLMLMRNTLAATIILASAAFAGTPPAHGQTTDVRFVLDFLLQGQQSAFVLGRERGYYAAQKVNLTAFDPGRGGADSIAKVASGTHDVGFGDLSAMIEFNAR